MKICRNESGIIIDVAQGSEEWLNLRRGKVTGTRAHTVLCNGKGSQTLVDELVIELMSEPKESYKSAAMIRGSELEVYARKAFEIAEFERREVVEVGCVMHPSIRDFMISPDGLFQDYGLLEIKCFEAKNYFEHLRDYKRDPSGFTFKDKKYITQVQAGLCCTQNDFARCVIYNPDFYGNEYIEFEIERDEKTISLLEELVQEVIYKRDEILKEFEND